MLQKSYKYTHLTRPSAPTEQPTTRALMMVPRLGPKRLQANCQARRASHHQSNSPELPIFRNISINFGRSTLKTTRHLENFACRLASTQQQLRFLHECLRQQILPRSICYRPPLNQPEAWNMTRQHSKRMLRLMITDAHNRIRKYNRHVEDLKATCLRELGATLFEQLETAIERKVQFTTEKKRENLNRKISKLAVTQQQNTYNRQAWIRNFSSRNLTNKEEEVLIKGLNYNFKDASKLEYLASLEAALTTSNLTEDAQQNIRQTIVPVITRNRTYNTLSKDEQQAMDNLKHDSNIVILPADKGRMTVVMDKPDYIDKAKALLNDTNIYRRLQEDYTKKLANQINTTLKKLK